MTQKNRWKLRWRVKRFTNFYRRKVKWEGQKERVKFRRNIASVSVRVYLRDEMSSMVKQG